MIRIRAIGTSEIRIGRKRILPDSAVLFGLLLYLGMNAGEGVPRERILELLWSDRALSSRRHALRQLLYRLRQVGVALEREAGELLLGASAAESDLAVVLAPEWPEQATADDIIVLADILPGYVPPLSEPFREWLDALRARVSAQYRRAVVLQIGAARREGRWADVEEWAPRCLAIDPLNEEATLAYVEATVMSGAKARALDILDEYRRELGDKEPVIGLPARVLRRRISEHQTPRPPTSTGGWQFVGREKEMAALDGLLVAARSGVGSSVALVGPPGIGKTRLAREFFAASQIQGVASASIRLQAKDSTRAMALFTELVPQLLCMRGALGCAPDTLVHLRRLFERPTDSSSEEHLVAEELRHRTRLSLVELIEALADEQTLLLFVDDVQHLDDVSRDLLGTVMASQRAMWLLSSQRAVSHVLPNLNTPVQEIRIGGLHPSAVSRLMLSAVPATAKHPSDDFADWCYHVSGGNPLFLRELIHNWIQTGERDTVPLSLRTIVRNRLSHLTRDALRTLQACAALGNNASIGLLIEALARDSASLCDSIEELESQGLLGGRSTDALAVHDLIATEALDSVTPALLTLLHFRIGTALEAAALASWAPQIAWDAATHLARAGEAGRALRLLRECARHFLEIGLPGQAAALLREGRSYARTTKTRLDVLSAEIHAMRHAGDWPGIIKTVSEVRELATQSGELSTVADELVLVQVEAAWYVDGNIDRTLEDAMDFVRRPSLPSPQLARAANLAMILADNMCRPDLMDEIRDAVSTSAVDDDKIDTNLILVRGMHATAFGRFTEGANLFRRVAQKERECGSVWAHSRALRHWSVALRRGGDYDGALKRLLEAYRLAGEYGLSVSAACSADAISGLYFEIKDFRESRRWLELGLSSNGGTGARVIARSLDNQRLKLSAHTKERLMEAGEVLDYEGRVLSDPVVRRRNEDLAALIYWFVSLTDFERVEALADRLERGLRQCAKLSMQHYWVAAYLTALCAGRDKARARAFAVEYEQTAEGENRSRPWYLKDALERCFC